MELVDNQYILELEDNHYQKLIMYTPQFNPEDVLFAETFLPHETIMELIFSFCNSHVTLSYSFYDELTNVATDLDWNMLVQDRMLQVLSNMGGVLFNALAINSVLNILLYSEILNVEVINNNSWLVKFNGTDAFEAANVMKGLANVNYTQPYQFQPSTVNYPHTNPRAWALSVLDGTWDTPTGSTS